MKVLVISPSFPPLAESEAFCGGKLVQGLIDAGVEASVIHCTNVSTPRRFDTSKLWNSLAAVSVDVRNPQRRPLGSRLRLALRYQTTVWAGWTAAVVSKAYELHCES